MTRRSKGILDAGWALFALTLAGCAATPESPETPVEEPTTEAPATEAATPQPANVPSVEAAPAVESAPVPTTAAQEPLVLNDNVPKRYTVKRGDTLWELASRYLRDPWRWPELWQQNPQVANPHLIYPGDQLTLVYVDGQPMLQVQRPAVTPEVAAPVPAPQAAAPAPAPEIPAPAPAPTPTPAPTEVPAGRPYPTVKLSPQIRTQSLDKAIPTIPLDVISQFLSRPRIVTEEELDEAPYIFSSVDEHLTAGAGHRVYVRGIDAADTADFIVVRRGQAYVNPDDDDDILGFEAIHVAEAKLARMGDPATFDLVRTNREVLNGDRLLPADDGFVEQNFMPHAPARFVDGSILAVHGGVMQIGQYQVVVVDKGTEAGLDIGSVMAVYQASSRVRDNIAGEVVRLPRERAGTIMIFRAFQRLSYALVMDATRPIHINDAVTSP